MIVFNRNVDKNLANNGHDPGDDLLGGRGGSIKWRGIFTLSMINCRHHLQKNKTQAFYLFRDCSIFCVSESDI